MRDADKAVELRPEWAKAYSRRAYALTLLQRLDEAEAAYRKGLVRCRCWQFADVAAVDGFEAKRSWCVACAYCLARQRRRQELDSSNASLKAGLAQLEQIKSQGLALQLLWKTIDWWAALQAHPAFADKCTSEFRDKLDRVAADPNRLREYADDKDVTEAVQYLVMAWQHAMKDRERQQANEERRRQALREAREREEAEAKQKAAEEAAAREAAMTDEERKAGELKKEAAAAYKAKRFDEAVSKYSEALELTSDDVSLLTNRAAVHIVAGNYDAALADGEKAIEVARAQRADYAVVARGYERVGTALEKKGQLEDALKAYNTSLAEHRTASVLNKMKNVERELEAARKKAYEDPEKAAEARAEGNRLFKEKRFPEAIKQYEEAIKRDPRDPSLHTNMATALGKLMEWPSAVSACDRALALDESFVKAHVKKGHFCFYLKDYKNALDSYRKALELEPDNKEAQESIDRTQVAIRKRNYSGDNAASLDAAQRDPEIQAILQDPAMQKVLQDLSTDPAAAADHLKHPAVAEKIEKLIAAGIIKTG